MGAYLSAPVTDKVRRWWPYLLGKAYMSLRCLMCACTISALADACESCRTQAMARMSTTSMASALCRAGERKWYVSICKIVSWRLILLRQLKQSCDVSLMGAADIASLLP